MRKYGSPAIRRMYNDLLMEAARAEKQRDPYVLYGMAYEGGNKNKEALDYLLNTSVTRGYTDDALFYIREAKKQYGNTDKGIMYKEYMLYRQIPCGTVHFIVDMLLGNEQYVRQCFRI